MSAGLQMTQDRAREAMVLSDLDLFCKAAGRRSLDEASKRVARKNGNVVVLTEASP